MVSGDLRHSLGVATGHVIGWMPAILPFHVVLFILAAITGLYASLIQKYTMDWDFLRNQQEKMKRVQRQMKEAQLSGDQSRQQQLQNEQMKMVSEQGKMMQMQFKPMLYIGIVSIPLFMWAYLYIGENPELVITFPFWGTQLILNSYWPGDLLVLLVLRLLSSRIADHSQGSGYREYELTEHEPR